MMSLQVLNKTGLFGCSRSGVDFVEAGWVATTRALRSLPTLGQMI